MNKKAIIGIVIVIILIIAIIAGVSVSKIITNQEEIIIIDFDVSRARTHVEELIKNGPRMSGSQEELLGAEYIVKQYEEWKRDSDYY